ncbi:MAG: radical SAM protein, partial [Phycisphaerales bacterium]|nr:radical SAM protein [Phycisphaerales bacterium]
VDKYNRIPIQTARGCPHACDFCASSILLTKGYSTKPAERVDAELRAVKAIWSSPFIELADDNSFASRSHARAVLDVLREHNVRWFTEADLSIADDPELLDAMAAAGCRQVLVGLESPVGSALDNLELRRNWKLRQFPRYEAAVRMIQSRGITVNGCFILGLDGHDESVFDRVFEFAQRTHLWDVQITVLTPFPGTPLYARLLAEGRILEPGAWEKCTLFDVNFAPLGMSPERLQRGLVELAGRLYAEDAVRARREGYFAGLVPGAKGRHRRAHASA